MDSKNYFNDVANQWDTMRKEFFSDEIREKAFDTAMVEAGKLAADVGAGTGYVTEGLISRGLSVVAIDQSEEMLQQMKDKFKGNDSIKYRLGTSNDLPLEDNKDGMCYQPRPLVFIPNRIQTYAFKANL